MFSSSSRSHMNKFKDQTNFHHGFFSLTGMRHKPARNTRTQLGMIFVHSKRMMKQSGRENPRRDKSYSRKIIQLIRHEILSIDALFFFVCCSTMKDYPEWRWLRLTILTRAFVNFFVLCRFFFKSNKTIFTSLFFSRWSIGVERSYSHAKTIIRLIGDSVGRNMIIIKSFTVWLIQIELSFKFSANYFNFRGTSLFFIPVRFESAISNTSSSFG